MAEQVIPIFEKEGEGEGLLEKLLQKHEAKKMEKIERRQNSPSLKEKIKEKLFGDKEEEYKYGEPYAAVATAEYGCCDTEIQEPYVPEVEKKYEEEKVSLDYEEEYEKHEEKKKHAGLLEKLHEKHEEKKLEKKLHRSHTSSSSSSEEEYEEDGIKKTRKNSLKEKIKEKFAEKKQEEEYKHEKKKEEEYKYEEPYEKYQKKEEEYKSVEPYAHVEKYDKEDEYKIQKPCTPLKDYEMKEEECKYGESYAHNAETPQIIGCYAVTEAEHPEEKKGFLEKIKEKIPGFHHKSEEGNEKEKDKEKEYGYIF